MTGQPASYLALDAYAGYVEAVKTGDELEQVRCWAEFLEHSAHCPRLELPRDAFGEMVREGELPF